MPDAKIGSMLARTQSYPKTPKPAGEKKAGNLILGEKNPYLEASD